MVDPSLLRQAADRGVTICFADLDGADGLWVPEERTVLVDRRLSEREVAEVIEHELGHVAIDDQHAHLDAGIGGRPPGRPSRWPRVLTAAACLAVLGGVTAGLAGSEQGRITDERVVAPSLPPLTAEPPLPTRVTAEVGPDGTTVYKTVTLVASAPAQTSAARTRAGTTARPATRATSVVAPPARTAASSQASVTPTPEPTTSPTPPPTTPEATTVAPTSEVAASTDAADGLPEKTSGGAVEGGGSGTGGESASSPGTPSS